MGKGIHESASLRKDQSTKSGASCRNVHPEQPNEAAWVDPNDQPIWDVGRDVDH